MKRTVEFVLGIVGVSIFGLGVIFFLLSYSGSAMNGGEPDYDALESVLGTGIVTVTGVVAVVILNKYPKVAANIFFVSAISYSLVFLVRLQSLVLLLAMPLMIYLATGIFLIVNKENKARNIQDQVQILAAKRTSRRDY